MGLFDAADEQAVMVSRTDETDPLSSFSGPAFTLDDCQWMTVEHYFQANKFESDDVKKLAAAAPTAKKARQIGRGRFRKVRRDWSKVKRIMMTRALYTKCKTHPEVAEALLNTGDRKIIENNNYDYFWGCGRDRRGENAYGQILCEIRAKLIEEQQQ